jgi:hypothetical protein
MSISHEPPCLLENTVWRVSFVIITVTGKMVTCEIQEYKKCFYCSNSWNPKYILNFVSTSDKMEPFGRSGHSWDKINHTQIRCEDGEWTVCHYSSDPSMWGRRHQFFQLCGLCILISNNLTTLDLNVKKLAWNKLHYSSSLVTSLCHTGIPQIIC